MIVHPAHIRFLRAASPLDPHLRDQSSVTRADTALVVMDAQHKYCSKGNLNAVEVAPANISSACNMASKASLPVFFVYTTPTLSPEPSAHLEGEHRLYKIKLTGSFELVAKNTHSALRINDRGELLLNDKAPLRKRQLEFYPNVSHFIFAGFNLGVCLKETAIDAIQKGYKASILIDCSENAHKQDPLLPRYDYPALRRGDLKALRDNGAGLITLDQLADILNSPGLPFISQSHAAFGAPFLRAE